MAREEWTPESVRSMLMNPRYCLSTPPVVSEDQWIQANVWLIKEIGAEKYLAQLLDSLRPDYA